MFTTMKRRFLVILLISIFGCTSFTAEADFLKKVGKGLKQVDFNQMYGDGKHVLIDIKGMLDRIDYENAGYIYWRL